MLELSVSDILFMAFFGLSGVYVVFKIGEWIVRLAIIRFFCNQQDIEDLGWKLFELCDLKHGKLQPAEAYIITTKAYTLTVKRLPPPNKPKPLPAP